MTFTHALATNNYGPAKFIVSSSAANGTHTTIAAALTSASSGDTIFIRPGTYTENPTLKAGVNLSAYTADAFTPNVIINGKCTATFAGTATLSGIQLQTNSDFCLAVTGSAATIINLQNCFINALNNTAISFTTSSSSAQINLYNCNGEIQTTGIAYFSHSSAGILRFNGGLYDNVGLSTTNCTCSAGSLFTDYVTFNSPITVSGTTSTLQGEFTKFFTASQNATCLTITTTNANPSTLFSCEFASGTASSISIGAGAGLVLSHSALNSSNTNVITGSGALSSGFLSYLGASSAVNVSTLFTLPGSLVGTFTPGVAFGGSSTGITYSFQNGFYTVLGNAVAFSITVALSSKGAQTGNATITGLPFAQGANAAFQYFSIPAWANFSLTAGNTSLLAEGIASSTTMIIAQFNPSTGTVTQLTNTQFTNTSSFNFTGTYLIT